MTKDDFLKGVANWDNHRYLLWPALEATKGLVVEFGMGHGSTPFLNQYCTENKRELCSYDNTLDWVDKFREYGNKYHRLFLAHNWEDVEYNQIDVMLIDHAAGERRKFDIAKYANIARIMVIHDTEPAADHGYQMRAELAKFKYIKEHESEGAWASMVSNFVDVSKL